MYYFNTPLSSGFFPAEKFYERGMKVLCKEKKPVKTDKLSPITFFPLFEDSVQDKDNEEAGFTSAIVDQNTGDTFLHTAVKSSSVHTDEGSVAQSPTGSVTEEGISNAVNPAESVSNSNEGFSVIKKW